MVRGITKIRLCQARASVFTLLWTGSIKWSMLATIQGLPTPSPRHSTGAPVPAGPLHGQLVGLGPHGTTPAAPALVAEPPARPSPAVSLTSPTGSWKRTRTVGLASRPSVFPLMPPSKRPALPRPLVGGCKTNKSSQGSG